MNEGQGLDFASGSSRAETQQIWHVAPRTEVGQAGTAASEAGQAAGAENSQPAGVEISKFATAGGAAEQYREKAEQAATQNEMMERGVFSQASPEQDITGNGLVSDTEAELAQDAIAESQMGGKQEITGASTGETGGVGALGTDLKFADKRLEMISEQGTREVETIVKQTEDDPAQMVTKIDDARWTFLRNNFNRNRGDGYGGMGA